MTPLQLSSIALKQSSGPVGVHACASAAPSGPTTFATRTTGEAAFADVVGSGVHAATATATARGEMARSTRHRMLEPGPGPLSFCFCDFGDSGTASAVAFGFITSK